MRRALPLLCSLLLISLYTTAQKDCPDAGYKMQLLSAKPEIAKKLEAVENFIQNNTHGQRVALSATGGYFSLPDVITIPVVVHILYNTDAQNISDALVQSQIDALNNDYRKKNSDQSDIPAYFADIAADCGIEFKLAKRDPKGFATTGIVRRKSSIQSFGTDDRAKYTSQGGDDAWDASRYLNIWVCNLTGGIIGYSSVMGCDAKIDGIVIYTGAFGVNPSSGSSFNKGRTATHEIGHWLNLKHIWGDTYCGDDKIDDTPPQRSPNHGCPSGKSFTCGTTANGDMYMNYMDLTNDACMHMFTQGQQQRMRALFMPGGPRNTLLTSNALYASAAGAMLENEAIATSVLQVYPNPAATFINITSADAGITFIIYNHLGQPVQSVISKAGVTTADISHLANGIYYLRAKDNNKNKTVKFVKAG
jgi:hypothetical protein